MTRTALIGVLVAVIGIATSPSSADSVPIDDYPKATLTGNGVTLTVFLPDDEKGINRGTRFDRSGFVRRASYKGHTWFGPWHDWNDPERGDNVMGTAGEFGMGTNGMPPPLGWDDAPEGGPCVKIGVGILCKKGDAYRFSERYEVLEPGAWATESSASSIAFRQELSADTGYGYRYEKRIALDETPGFSIEYTLENTGRHPIVQTYYAHNFVLIDDEPVGPAYRVTFREPMTPDRDLLGIAGIEGRVLTFNRELRDRILVFNRELMKPETVYTQFVEHDLDAAWNGALVENTATGAGIRITGDRPLSRFHFWATRLAVCPEPFVAINIAPGDTYRWKNTYELLVNEE